MASSTRPSIRRLTAPQFLIALLVLVALAGALRGLYPAADPPWRTRFGVVWHDEGAWTHNARNRALFGQWRTDEWNPMYVAPVFTGLEYLSFEAFGVGLRQARLVSMVIGTLAVGLLGLGVARTGGRLAGLIAAALLATSYVSVMFDRAALMEATMVGLLVASWCCVAMARSAPPWGLAAGTLGVAAYFTKASAVFFLAALGLTCLIELRGVLERFVRASRGSSTDRRGSGPWIVSRRERAALWCLTGLAAGAAVALAAFVVPSWEEYVFYNWQMSVVRKPSYGLGDLLDRATWLPIVHDYFTRLWLVTLVGICGLVGIAVRWRHATAADLLLALWIGIGTAELIAHDVGNERRLVLLGPPLIAITALRLGRRRHLLPASVADVPLRRALLAAPVVLFAIYVVVGSMARLAFLYDIQPGVRLSAALALPLCGLVYASWPRLPRWLADGRWSARQAVLVTIILVAGGLVQYGQWAWGRGYENYDASVALGEHLPPGTLVHGKLANGLALENRIQPIFVGREFGNYDDRLSRPDVRYMVTYIAPWLAYEGAVFREVVEAYPERRVLWSFPVSESIGGQDRAALIEKAPLAAAAPPPSPEAAPAPVR